MGVVPSGSFTMGSPNGDNTDVKNFEGPRHEVAIGAPFAVAIYEVTFAEWDACFAALGCPRITDEDWGRGQTTGHQPDLGRGPAICELALQANRSTVSAAFGGRMGVCGAGRNNDALFVRR